MAKNMLSNFKEEFGSADYAVTTTDTLHLLLRIMNNSIWS